VEKFTVNPARLLRLKKGTLSIGADADVTVIDLNREWTYDVAASASKSRNSPFHGWEFHGRVVATVVNGEIVWRENGQG
jgi:dihydroorotase